MSVAVLRPCAVDFLIISALMERVLFYCTLGLNAKEIGRIFHKLMTRLEFDNYYIQGGDWGGLIVDLMAGMFPR